MNPEIASAPAVAGDLAVSVTIGVAVTAIVAVVMLVRSYRGPRERRLFQGGGLNVRD